MAERKIQSHPEQAAAVERRERQRLLHLRYQVIGLLMIAVGIVGWWLWHTNPAWIFPSGWWRL